MYLAGSTWSQCLYILINFLSCIRAQVCIAVKSDVNKNVIAVNDMMIAILLGF